MKSHEGGWGRYFKVQGVFANQDTTANRTGFDADTFGGQFGLDYSYSPNLVIGLAVGYTFTNANLDGGLGDIEDQTIRGGPYMSYYKDDWYVDASLTFGWHMFEIATSLYFLRGEPIYPQAYDAVIAGYRRQRELDEQQLAQLPILFLARAFTYVGWVHTRPETETAQEMGPAILDMALATAEDYWDNH